MNTEPVSFILQMLATIIVLRLGKMLGVISFADMDLNIPRKVSLITGEIMVTTYRT